MEESNAGVLRNDPREPLVFSRFPYLSKRLIPAFYQSRLLYHYELNVNYVNDTYGEIWFVPIFGVFGHRYLEVQP